MKFAIILTFLCLVSRPDVAGQPENITVKNINEHEILADGTQSGKWFTKVQQTYNSKYQLVLERFYDGEAKKQVSFTWYYYDDHGRLKSSEHFDLDKNPLLLKQFEYNGSGDTLKIVTYTGNKEGVAKTVEKHFRYSAEGQLLQSVTTGPGNKTIELTKYGYKKGKKSPISVTTKNTSASPFSEKVKLSYNDSTGLPVEVLKQVKLPKPAVGYNQRITYNEKGKPVEENFLVAGKLIRKKTNEYAALIELTKIVEEDGQGKMIALTLIDTYFHKANLDVKSYFEK